MMNERIPQEVLDRAHRRLSRGIAATIVRVMADTDTSIEELAVRLGKPADKVKSWLDRMIQGKQKSLDQISDMLIAMGCELIWAIERRPQEPTTEPATTE